MVETTPKSIRDQTVKMDAGKNRLELFPPEAILAISEILTFGTGKYKERGWENGQDWSRVFGATLRHLYAWWGAKSSTTSTNFLFGDLDTETGRSHLWHAGCCIVFLITYEERQIGNDDRHKNEVI
jgi:hypothetical protein